MKHKTLLWFALVLSGALFGFGNIAFCAELPPTNGPSKLQLDGVWSNLTIQLVIPGLSNPPVKCIIEDIPAQRADYKVVPSPPMPYWDKFSILAVHDPHAKMNCIIFANHTFFSSGKSGLTGFHVFSPGVYWSSNFVAVPDAEGNLETAIAKFEMEFDGWKLNNGLLREKHDKLGFQRVSPLFYFQEQPIGGSKGVTMKVDSFAITDGILQLDLRNPATQKPATYWLNPELHKIVKAVVDGVEMDVNGTGQPWGEPLRK